MQKTRILLAALCCLALPAIAQKFDNKLQLGLRKGGWQAAVGANYYLLEQSTNYYATPITSSFNYFGENVSGGYFFGRNIMVGASLHHGWQSEKSNVSFSNLATLTQLSAAPLLRVYLPFDEQFSLYAEAQYGYVFDSYSMYALGNGKSYLIAQRTTSGTGGYLGGGMLILLEKHLGLDLNMNFYTNTTIGTQTYPSAPTTNQDRIATMKSSGVTFRLGLQYFLFSDKD
jgi:hypothetical protein